MKQSTAPYKKTYTVALVGNPNVGKSTVFNGLTGMHQHTGNWPGKTVELAQGTVDGGDVRLQLVDLPGTYSLFSHSAEEDVTRDFLAFGQLDLAVVVCDATCLARHMNLALQVMEIAPRTVLCVNLLDEAHRKGITVDLKRLSENLGVPAVGTVASKKASLRELVRVIRHEIENTSLQNKADISYPPILKDAVRELSAACRRAYPDLGCPSAIALRLLEEDEGFCTRLQKERPLSAAAARALAREVDGARRALFSHGTDAEGIREIAAEALEAAAVRAACGAVHTARADVHRRDRRIDALLTGRFTAYPAMLLLLALVFFLTLYVSAFPSEALSALFSRGERWLGELLNAVHAPPVLYGLLVHGVYRVTTWVIAVMLPPMAIFFPLFTLLEDVGYLPRIAYNLDRPFARCHACGKQALTMCMGFGCNAVGVTGCRIMDSRRERLLAILTNSLVPCNGRFPTVIALLTVFFVGTATSPTASLVSALLLSAAVLVAVCVTLLVTWLLSVTLLRGEPSAFTLELPPYRTPRIGKILVRSVLDRTLFVLGRAVAVAAPAGVVLWLMTHVTVADASLLRHMCSLLDPLGRALGMDGVILSAFILGFPAGEIVVPIMLMAYLSTGVLQDTGSLVALREVLVAFGWTYRTALCTVLFCLFHFPCSTTLLTVAKETRSAKYTLLAAAVPTAVGMALCFLVNLLLP